MNQFTLTSKHKIILFVLMGIGVACLGITFFLEDDYHSRFWSNILINTIFFTGISLLAFFLYSAHHIAYAGWHTVFKRLWEAMFPFLIPGIGILLILGLGTYFDFHYLYHWSHEESVANDEILQGKSSFLNPTVYIIATLVVGGLWIFLSRKMRNLSLREDKEGTTKFKIHKKMRVIAAITLPVIGFGSAVCFWLWVMSVDSHWYSTLYAWYLGASLCVAMFAITLVLLYWFKSLDNSYFAQVTNEHIHDLGKYLFAFSIFWTYLWFSQYMLIWYGNVGEETVYFNTRHDQFPVLFYGNLIINFALPFIVLMRNDTKRKKGTIMLVSIAVFIGHFLDVFLMVKPGVLHTAHEIAEMDGGHGAEIGHATAENIGHAEAVGHHAEHASSFISGFTLPGFLEIGTMLGFLGFFLFIVLTSLSKAKLIPEKDPYLEESLHHHV